MTGVGQILATILWIYWLLFILRIVLDLLQAFARSWHPRGPILLVAEAVYSVTDPPIRALRRVIPPLRLGNVQLDLAFLIVLILLQILIGVAAGL